LQARGLKKENKKICNYYQAHFGFGLIKGRLAYTIHDLVYRVKAGGLLVHPLRKCAGAFIPLGRFLVKHGLGVGLVGWVGLEVLVKKLLRSGKGFNTVHAEHVV
jgi:hypothetical protein